MIHPVIDLDIPETVPALLNVQSIRQINAVMHAQTSPFYQGKLDHLDIDNVSREDEWLKIPLLETSALRAMDQATFMSDFCVAPRDEVTAFWQADSHLYPRTGRDTIYAMIGMKRALVLAGFTQKDNALMSLPFGAGADGQMMARSGSDIGVGIISGGGRDTLPAAQQLQMLHTLDTSAWIGGADYGIQLAHLARGQRIDLPGEGIERILTTGAPLPDAKRRALARGWGAEVRDCWGLPEMMLMGCEDTDCYGFRLWSDYCFAEILDPDSLEPVGEGQPGLLVLTSLVTNNATPFLRWNTGQTATLRSRVRRGKDGSPFDVYPLLQPQSPPRMMTIQGKVVDADKLEAVLLGADEVVDYRVSAGADGVEVEIEVHAGAERQVIAKRVAEKLYQATHLEVIMTVCKANEIAQAVEAAGDDVRLRTAV